MDASGEAALEPGCSAVPSHSYQQWRSLTWVRWQYRLLLRLIAWWGRVLFRAAARHRSRWVGGSPADSAQLIPIKSPCQLWIVTRASFSGD